jgi:hypothetical protein
MSKGQEMYVNAMHIEHGWQMFVRATHVLLWYTKQIVQIPS